MEKFQKREISLRYWLLGRGYTNAVKAMEFGQAYHTGFRKDGVTPEFDHQISIAQYVRTMISGLSHPEETLCTVFLHDVREDFDVSDGEIRSEFGDQVADAVETMTKKFRGVSKRSEDVFASIAANSIASVAKGADRIHNHQTMVGVFSDEKQRKYMEETKAYFFPMLKAARRKFVEQEPVYENIKHMLVSQIELIQAIHEAKERN